MSSYEHLVSEFLDAMNDIGRYGSEKYGNDSFQARRLIGDRERKLKRCSTNNIIFHINGHAYAYHGKVKHDHFHTMKHQLAAVAFNAMMEFYFAGLEEEESAEGPSQAPSGPAGT